MRTAQSSDAAVLRESGQAHHSLGEFELARIDYEAALAAATASGDQLAEAFAFAGLTPYVDAFANLAQSELDAPFATLRPNSNGHVDFDTRLTHLIIVEDQDRTRGGLRAGARRNGHSCAGSGHSPVP